MFLNQIEINSGLRCPACQSSVVVLRETIGDVFTGELAFQCVNEECPGEELLNERT